MRRLCTLTLTVLALASCGRHEVTREEWRAGRAEDRVLVVRSLIGGEEALAAKGEKRSRYSRSADQYVREIDRRYDAGETRPVDELWAELADPGV